MPQPRKPWVIFATDRRRLGAPVRCVARPAIAYFLTLSRRRALRFATPGPARHMAAVLAKAQPRYSFVAAPLGLPARGPLPAAAGGPVSLGRALDELLARDRGDGQAVTTTGSSGHSPGLGGAGAATLGDPEGPAAGP